MPDYAFDWIDAFSSHPFAGNGCVVVHRAQDIALDTRMALVRETSLSECAYVVPSQVADFGARYYLAGSEIAMAGHPTVATVVSLVRRGLVDLSSGAADFTLEVGAGVIGVEVSGSAETPLVTMTQPRPQFGPRVDPARIAAIYGLSPAQIVGQPQFVSTGPWFCVTCLTDRAALEGALLDLAALAAFQADHPDFGGQLTVPFLVTRSGATPRGDTYARLLLPPPNPAEDPFTGSATGAMAAYLWANALIDSPHFTAEQGHLMGRPGSASIEVLGPRDAVSGVKVGGTGAIVMSGHLHLP